MGIFFPFNNSSTILLFIWYKHLYFIFHQYSNQPPYFHIFIIKSNLVFFVVFSLMSFNFFSFLNKANMWNANIVPQIWASFFLKGIALQLSLFSVCFFLRDGWEKALITMLRLSRLNIQTFSLKMSALWQPNSIWLKKLKIELRRKFNETFKKKIKN